MNISDEFEKVRQRRRKTQMLAIVISLVILVIISVLMKKFFDDKYVCIDGHVYKQRFSGYGVQNVPIFENGLAKPCTSVEKGLMQ